MNDRITTYQSYIAMTVLESRIVTPKDAESAGLEMFCYSMTSLDHLPFKQQEMHTCRVFKLWKETTKESQNGLVPSMHVTQIDSLKFADPVIVFGGDAINSWVGKLGSSGRNEIWGLPETIAGVPVFVERSTILISKISEPSRIKYVVDHLRPFVLDRAADRPAMALTCAPDGIVDEYNGGLRLLDPMSVMIDSSRIRELHP